MIKAERTPRGFDEHSAQTVPGMPSEVGGPSRDCCFPDQIAGQDGEGASGRNRLARILCTACAALSHVSNC